MGDELVECHSGYTYPERPVALWWEGMRLEIETVEAEWRTPEGKRFQVLTRDRRRFELNFQENESEWHVALIS